MVVVSCIPQDNFIYMESSVGRKLKGANVLPEIIGKTSMEIGVVANERQLYIEFTDHNFLRINIFGAMANVYYTDSEGVIINSFLKPSTEVGKKLPVNPNTAGFPENCADLRTRYLKTTGNFVQRLSRCVPTIDSILAREISHRYSMLRGVSEDHSGQLDLRDNESQLDFELLAEVFAKIKKELLTPSPRIYLSEESRPESGQDGRPVAFGLIELRHLQLKKFRQCDSVNECVRDFAIDSEKDKKILGVKNDVVGKLNRKVVSLKQTLAKIETDLKNNRSEKYQSFGEYLMSHLADINKGDGSVFIGENGTEIKLNPVLKPVQNAQVYFDKAKHARISIRQAEQRKKDIIKQLQETEAVLNQAEEQEDVKFLNSLKENGSVDEGRRSPFREFEQNGYRIYVGKDAKNNDELTFGFAKPNDIFLHARGVSGSHVIIRNPSRDYPQKPVLEFAASIAAHYSKARTSNIVPVAYTMRKFVKKAKGKPGAVFVDREEVIFVKPGIHLAVNKNLH